MDASLALWQSGAEDALLLLRAALYCDEPGGALMTTTMLEHQSVGVVQAANLPSTALPLRPALLSPRWTYAISVIISVIFLAADVVLPRGATAAIGYCFVPVVAAGATRRGFLLLMTILCTILTAVGYFTEAPGAAWWMSLFDRGMVMGVLWLTFVLVKRRAAVIQALVDQTQALETATRELRRSNIELERFASVVAHDLRGPLNTVGLLAELLTQNGSVRTNAECNDCIGTIRQELNRMSGFIQSLLDYGRVGARDIDLADCDLSAVLSDVKQRLKADLERCSGQISSDPLPVLKADPVLMAELFQNLIENSIKYRSSSPLTVHVTAECQSGLWQLSLRDNGIGIRAGDCGRIFAPFSQVCDGQSVNKGVGLGLATCKRIVERHGGRIWVESTLGEGATFRFTIPELTDATPAATFPSAPDDTSNMPEIVAGAV